MGEEATRLLPRFLVEGLNLALLMVPYTVI